MWRKQQIKDDEDLKLAGGKPTEKTIISTSIGLGGVAVKSESSSSSSLSVGVGVGGGTASHPPVSYTLPTATGATTMGGVGSAIGVIYPNLPHPGVTLLGGGYGTLPPPVMYPGVIPSQYSTMPPPMMMPMPMTALGESNVNYRRAATTSISLSIPINLRDAFFSQTPLRPLLNTFSIPLQYTRCHHLL